MATVSTEQLRSLSNDLLNPATPLHKRFRALFTLKAIGGPEAISTISKGFGDESALLKHEFAYVLGQMKDQRAIKKLEEVLSDEKEDPMVRHEVGLPGSRGFRVDSETLGSGSFGSHRSSFVSGCAHKVLLRFARRRSRDVPNCHRSNTVGKLSRIQTIYLQLCIHFDRSCSPKAVRGRGTN
jgi:hypothetical protein